MLNIAVKMFIGTVSNNKSMYMFINILGSLIRGVILIREVVDLWADLAACMEKALAPRISIKTAFSEHVTRVHKCVHLANSTNQRIHSVCIHMVYTINSNQAQPEMYIISHAGACMSWPTATSSQWKHSVDFAHAAGAKNSPGREVSAMFMHAHTCCFPSPAHCQVYGCHLLTGRLQVAISMSGKLVWI